MSLTDNIYKDVKIQYNLSICSYMRNKRSHLLHFLVLFYQRGNTELCAFKNDHDQVLVSGTLQMYSKDSETSTVSHFVQCNYNIELTISLYDYTLNANSYSIHRFKYRHKPCVDEENK